MTEISHERCSELLGDFVAGELADDDVAAVRTHLESCAECRAEEAGLRGLVAGAEVPMTDLERARLERGVLAAVGRAGRGAQGHRWGKAGAALGAAALLVIIGVAVAHFVHGGGGTASSAAVSGPDQNQAKRADRASGGAGESAALSATAGPVFVRHAGVLTDSKLKQIGRTNQAFHGFTRANDASKVPSIRDQYLQRLTRAAPTAAGDQIAQCSAIVFDSQNAAVLPVYGTSGRLHGRPALVLGFAWSARHKGPLDRFMFWAWPRDQCTDVPLDYQAGQIKR